MASGAMKPQMAHNVLWMYLDLWRPESYGLYIHNININLYLNYIISKKTSFLAKFLCVPSSLVSVWTQPASQKVPYSEVLPFSKSLLIHCSRSPAQPKFNQVSTDKLVNVHCLLSPPRLSEGRLAAQVTVPVPGVHVRVLVVGLHLDLDLWNRAGHPAGDGHRRGRWAWDLQVQGDAAERQGPITRVRKRRAKWERRWDGKKGTSRMKLPNLDVQTFIFWGVGKALKEYLGKKKSFLSMKCSVKIRFFTLELELWG